MLALAVGAIVAGGVVFALTRPDSIERTADRLRAESALRDRTQIKTLTELARSTRARLLPVLDGLSRAMPVDGTAGPVAVPAAAMDLAVRQRADALFTWSIGATALDAVDIDAGYGHQHVFLPTSPGEGALTPDTEPEGSHDS